MSFNIFADHCVSFLKNKLIKILNFAREIISYLTIKEL